jgi:hypothetical protein
MSLQPASKRGIQSLESCRQEGSGSQEQITLHYLEQASRMDEESHDDLTHNIRIVGRANWKF